jgi:hypothetical protein
MMESRSVQLNLQLLDHQLVDTNGRLCGNVDDLEIEVPDDGSPPYVSAILTGPSALAPRLGGRLGGWVQRLHNRIGADGSDEPPRISWRLVRDYGSHVRLSIDREDLATNASEAWLRDHVVTRIPGGRHAPK